jgi:prephenate dehydrogenase
MPPLKRGQVSRRDQTREEGEEDHTEGQVPVKLQHVAILGLGLMGASLGMAIRATNRNVVGYDRDQGVAERALACGAIDISARSAQDAVAEAELVVLAAPVLAIRDLLEAIRDALPCGAVVTDVGSVKSPVAAWAEEYLPEPELFVGGHPMTGREQSGVDAALPDLYTGCVWCLTPTTCTTSWAVRGVAGLTRELGARPYLLDTAMHDAVAAVVSHLPLIAATALVLTASRSTHWPAAQALAAGGFCDTTRVASSNSRMARDICLTNQQAILDILDEYQETLARLRRQIAAGDQAAILQTFQLAVEERETWLANRQDGPAAPARQ